jgi:hypothetical protein
VYCDFTPLAEVVLCKIEESVTGETYVVEQLPSLTSTFQIPETSLSTFMSNPFSKS